MSPEPTQPADATTDVITEAEPALTAEDLIEEVSIDGMCGVY